MHKPYYLLCIILINQPYTRHPCITCIMLAQAALCAKLMLYVILMHNHVSIYSVVLYRNYKNLDNPYINFKCFFI